MLTCLKTLEHPEVSGDETHSQAYQGLLPDAYELKLRHFVDELQGDIKSSPYGENREAWLIGEKGTVGDYEFSSHHIKLHVYDSWIWELARDLFEQTRHKLNADQFLVAFIPHYSKGGRCGAHQDKESNMRDDWIVSISLGETIQFQYGASKHEMKSTELTSLSVLGMSRWLWHAVPPIKGDRWNITFRCWKSNPDYHRLTEDFSAPEPSVKSLYRELFSAKSNSISSGRQRVCTICEENMPSIDLYVTHLRESHEVPTTKSRLLPYELSECPFCHKFFTMTGWTRHTGACKDRSPPDPTITWPKVCWVWWPGDKTWYKGRATGPCNKGPPSFNIAYADGESAKESDQFVVFTEPEIIHELDAKHPDPESNAPEAGPLTLTGQELEEGEVPRTQDHHLEDEHVKSIDDLLPDWFAINSCIPTRITEDKNDLTAILVDLHRKASHLRRLPPLRLWRGNQKRAWVRCTRQFTSYFQRAIHTASDSTDFLKLCLRLLELPSIILGPTLPKSKPRSGEAASLPFKVRKAESLAMQDRLHDATKVLFSHGITPPSEEVFTRLQALHPALKEVIPVIETNKDDQFFITPANAKKAMFRQCSETWKSLDPFGWSTALLHLIRALQPEEGPSFFDLCTEFVSMLANCEVPDSVAFVFTTGSLIALNKDPESVRKTRVEEGKQPRERPINQGTMFLKLAFGLALRSKPAQEAAESLMPIQQGLGSKRGMELISHACTGFYQQGYAILKKDATNGFQEISRAKMHRAVERRCPSLLPLFQKYYQYDSIGLYNTGDTVKCVRIFEGCRMGCKLSSFGFDLTVHDSYVSVKEQLDHSALDKSDHSFIKTATDDVIVVIKADPANPAALYNRVRVIDKKLGVEAAKVGLSFENDKGQLLFPKGWLPPDDGSLLPPLDFRSDVMVDINKQGIEIVGCPVGSLKFCTTFVTKTIKSTLLQARDLKLLHPQAATKLLLKCVAPAPGYLSQVCHPNVTSEGFPKFDRALWDLWCEILGGVGKKDPDQLKLCNFGNKRSQMWAYLPAACSGAGLLSWVNISKYSWFCSMAECSVQADLDFDRARAFRRTDSELAHKIALDELGGPTYENRSDFQFLPPEEPDVLVDSQFYEDWHIDHKNAKLSKEFSKFLAEKHLKFVTSGDQLDYNHVTDSEHIRSLMARKQPGQSVLTQLFTANLSDHEARISKTEFITSARQFLCLPALKIPRGEVVELECGCEAQKCPNVDCADIIIDPAGNHALMCHAGMGAKKATILERALERVFRKAGGKSERQPASTRLLGEVVPKEDMAALFPGRLNLEDAKKNGDLAFELVDALLMVPGVRKDSVIEEIRERLPKIDEDQIEYNNTIRYDLCLTAPFPHDAPRQLWLDHGIVQETSESYQEAMITYLESGKDLTRSEPFQRMYTTKQRRFQYLEKLATHLQKMRLLDYQPFFLYPVISSLGYLNGDAVAMVKFMSSVLNKCMPSQRDDGIPLGVIKARYRTEVRNALCFGVLRGNALAMGSVGRQFVSRPA